LYRKKFSHLQAKVDRAIDLLLEDFQYPSLHTEKLEGQSFMGHDVCSVRLDLEYKIHFVIIKDENIYFLIEISKHYQ